MAKSYKTLREKMSPRAQKRSALKAQALTAEMALAELRAARRLTQEQLATSMGINQAAVSKLERRADVYVSTLRHFVTAMGGTLEIRAKFPEGEVRITQFEELAERKA